MSKFNKDKLESLQHYESVWERNSKDVCPDCCERWCRCDDDTDEELLRRKEKS